MPADYKAADHCMIPFQSNAAIAANSTLYVGTGNTPQGNPNWGSVRVPYAGILRNMYCRASGAPGVGETYDYQVFVNGVGTIILSQTAGAALESEDLVNQVAVAAGDYVCIEVITSLNATVQLHSIGIELHG